MLCLTQELSMHIQTSRTLVPLHVTRCGTSTGDQIPESAEQYLTVVPDSRFSSSRSCRARFDKTRDAMEPLAFRPQRETHWDRDRSNPATTTM